MKKSWKCKSGKWEENKKEKLKKKLVIKWRRTRREENEVKQKIKRGRNWWGETESEKEKKKKTWRRKGEPPTKLARTPRSPLETTCCIASAPPIPSCWAPPCESPAWASWGAATPRSCTGLSRIPRAHEPGESEAPAHRTTPERLKEQCCQNGWLLFRETSKIFQ